MARPRSTSWRVDETYVKVRGQWAYLYWAIDKLEDTIDFYLSPTRNMAAAKRFLDKALNGLKGWEKPCPDRRGDETPGQTPTREPGNPLQRINSEAVT